MGQERIFTSNLMALPPSIWIKFIATRLLRLLLTQPFSSSSAKMRELDKPHPKNFATVWSMTLRLHGYDLIWKHNNVVSFSPSVNGLFGILSIKTNYRLDWALFNFLFNSFQIWKFFIVVLTERIWNKLYTETTGNSEEDVENQYIRKRNHKDL